MSLPESLTYRVSAPEGFPNTIKEVFFTPVQTTQAYLPNEVIRWEIRSNGYLDPYTTRLNFDVLVDDLSPDEIRRLDGSAHSFFSELRIQVRGVEVEIIREYDTIAQILHDIKWNANDRRIKAHEGHGFGDLSYGEFAWMENSYDSSYNSLRDQQFSEGYDPTDPLHHNYVAPSISDPSNFGGGRPYEELRAFFFDSGAIAANTLDQVSIINTSGVLENGSIFYPYIGGTGFILSTSVIGVDGTAWTGTVPPISQHPDNFLQANSEFGDDAGSRGMAWTTKKTQFKKNKCRWTHAGIVQPQLLYSGYEKVIGTDELITGTTTVEDTWNSWKPYEDFTTTAYAGYSTRVMRAMLSETNFEKVRISEQSYPSFWYLFNDVNLNQPVTITEALKQRMVVASLVWGSYTGQCNNYEENVTSFMNNAYFKTLPWTLTRRDKSTVYEVAAQNTEENYLRRVTKVPFYELGSNRMGFVEYDEEGYTMPYNPLYSSGTDEPYFAGSYVPVNRMFKGRTLQEQGRNFMSFSIPLLSGIFGVLLPPDLYKLIPMLIMEDLVIELRVNQYALFSSGFKSQYENSQRIENEIIDYRSDNNLRYQLQQNTRNFKIQRIEMFADILSFTQAVDSIVLSQFQSENGIVFQTHGWALGPQTIFTNTAAVQGTHQINYSFNSLKAIFWRFVPLDYERYNFCRKHFYINHNLTRFNLELGQDFVPIDGVRGEAGTPFGQENERYGSNKEFFNQMLKCFNKLHDMSGNMTINPFNFAVNERCYDVDARGSYYGVGRSQHGRTVFNGIIQPDTITTNAGMANTDLTLAGSERQNVGLVYVNNPHTALQLPGFHETRVVGKALFGYNLETMRTDSTIISGLNTYNFKPFNIVFEVDGDQTRHFMRQSKIFLFFFYDLLVQFKQGMAPVIVGRA